MRSAAAGFGGVFAFAVCLACIQPADAVPGCTSDNIVSWARARTSDSARRECPQLYEFLAQAIDRAPARTVVSIAATLEKSRPRNVTDGRRLLAVARGRHGDRARIAALHALAATNYVAYDSNAAAAIERILAAPTSMVVYRAAVAAAREIEGQEPSSTFFAILVRRLTAAVNSRDPNAIAAAAGPFSSIGTMYQNKLAQIPLAQTDTVAALVWAVDPNDHPSVGAVATAYANAVPGDVALEWLRTQVLPRVKADASARAVIVIAVLRSVNSNTDAVWNRFTASLVDSKYIDLATLQGFFDLIGPSATSAGHPDDGFVLTAQLIANYLHWSRPGPGERVKELVRFQSTVLALADHPTHLTDQQLNDTLAAVRSVSAYIDGDKRDYKDFYPHAEVLQIEADARKPWSRFRRWAGPYWTLGRPYWIPAAALLAAVVLAALIFWLRPLWLFALHRVLDPGAEKNLPPYLALPVKALAAAGSLRFHPHVQDAWLARYAKPARSRFMEQLGVKARYIAVPGMRLTGRSSTGKLLDQIDAGVVRDIMSRDGSSLLIAGEGGIGKTVLASYIAGIALADDETKRLWKFRSYPFIIGSAFDGAGLEKPEQLVDRLRLELGRMMGENESIPVEFVQAMLASKRIVVIADGVSEMPPHGIDLLAGFLALVDVRALVVTARNDAVLQQVDMQLIKPARLSESNLHSFVDEYVTSAGYAGFDTPTIDHVCDNLGTIVGKTTTPLMVKLYVDLYASEHDRPTAKLSIPTLMTAYVRYLNDKLGASKLPTTDVLDHAKRLARACCVDSHSYRSSALKLDELDSAFSNDPLPPIEYFNTRLTLIQLLEPENRVRFLIDPLCEYLAALYLVERACAAEGHDLELPASSQDEQSRFAFATFLDRIAECVQDLNDEASRTLMMDALRRYGWKTT